LAFTVADGKVVSSNVSLLGAATEGHDYRRGCFLFSSVCQGEPAWCLALDQLGVVGGDAIGDVGQWEMGRNSVEQELAEALPDFDLLALAVVGEGVGDDCRVVFIDDVVLGVGGGEDDGSMHGYPDAEEWRGGYVLVVDQDFVDSVEGCIHGDLAGDVVSFSVGGGFGGGCSREVARDLALGLGVHGRDKLGHGRLPCLGFLPQVLPSFNVGGVCGVFGWWVWLGGGCFGGVGVCTGAGAVVGRRAVGVVFVLGGSLPLSLPFFLWVGAGVALVPTWLSGGGGALCGREELLLHLGDSGAQRGDLLGQAVCGGLEGGVVLGKKHRDLGTNCSGELV